MKKFIRHCKKWNQWRKSCKNYLPYKIYVFFNPKISPTYQLFIRNEEMKELVDAFLKGVEDGIKEVEQKGGAEAQSPSEKGRELGEGFGKNFERGIEDGMKGSTE